MEEVDIRDLALGSLVLCASWCRIWFCSPPWHLPHHNGLRLWATVSLSSFKVSSFHGLVMCIWIMSNEWTWSHVKWGVSYIFNVKFSICFVLYIINVKIILKLPRILSIPYVKEKLEVSQTRDGRHVSRGSNQTRTHSFE